MPRVSVVMAVLDGGPFFEEALGSILGQSFRDFELIAVDSGSTDGTRERLAAETDPRLRVIDLPGRCGVSIPRNLGIAYAEGAYVAIMDADDVMHPERLARQVAFLDGNPGVDMVGTAFSLLHPDGTRRPRPQPTADALVKAAILNCNGSAIHDPTLMARASFLKERKLGFAMLPHDQIHPLLLDAVERGARFANLAEDLLTYRWHAGSATKRTGGAIQAMKTPIRARTILTFLPGAMAEEAWAAARVMEQGAALTLAAAREGLAAVDGLRSLREVAHGAHRGVLAGILERLSGPVRAEVARIGTARRPA